MTRSGKRFQYYTTPQAKLFLLFWVLPVWFLFNTAFLEGTILLYSILCATTKSFLKILFFSRDGMTGSIICLLSKGGSYYVNYVESPLYKTNIVPVEGITSAVPVDFLKR